MYTGVHFIPLFVQCSVRPTSPRCGKILRKPEDVSMPRRMQIPFYANFVKKMGESNECLGEFPPPPPPPPPPQNTELGYNVVQ